MVDIYELLRRDQDGTAEYVKEFLKSINVTFNVDAYGNIYYLDNENVPLLSAHMDTVRKEADFCIGAFLAESDSDKISSGGILGGDDKCGVYIILKVLEEGKKVNFIFSKDEEIGCLGIKALLKPKNVENKELTDKIRNNCLYCLVLDRRGNSDIICYENNYGTLEFETKLKEVSDAGGLDYKPARGACSDANTIREFISTANLSVGYFNPHSQGEYIVKADLEKAYDYTTIIIDTVTDKFKAYSYSYTYNNSGKKYNRGRYGYYDDDYEDYGYGYGYGYYGYGYQNYDRNKKPKCKFCEFEDTTENLYDFILPDGREIKICSYCIEDLEKEIKKVRLKMTT